MTPAAALCCVLRFWPLVPLHNTHLLSLEQGLPTPESFSEHYATKTFCQNSRYLLAHTQIIQANIRVIPPPVCTEQLDHDTESITEKPLHICTAEESLLIQAEVRSKGE